MLRRAARYGYLALGCALVALGVMGAFLPVLPTTVFMIGALWAFSMSSKRLETWLIEHPRFGPRLVAWREHRVIPLRVKMFAWSSMMVSLTIMAISGAAWWAMAMAAAVMLFGAIYIARCPSKVRPEGTIAPT